MALCVGEKKSGPFGLSQRVVSVGRTAGYGLHIPNSWVPRRLCRFLPFERGWVVQIGPRARMRVEDAYVGSHVFNPRAMVALQAGDTRLTFPELDDHCWLGVKIGPGMSSGLPLIGDTVVEDEPITGTAYGAQSLVMTPKQRTVVATVFEYLIKGEPKPGNLTTAAAQKLGMSNQAVKNVLGTVRDKINLERWGPAITDYEAIGHYLVVQCRNVNWNDLPEALR